MPNNPLNKWPGMFEAVGRALYRMGDPLEIHIDDIREALAPEYGLVIQRYRQQSNESFNQSVSRAVRERGYQKYRYKRFRKVST